MGENTAGTVDLVLSQQLRDTIDELLAKGEKPANILRALKPRDTVGGYRAGRSREITAYNAVVAYLETKGK